MTLYFFAILEIILAVLFFYLFILQFRREKEPVEGKVNLLTDRTVHRLIFKACVIMFLILSVAYQIFGDRARLREVGTYMAMTLVAYDIWYRTDRFLFELRKKKLAGIDDDDDTNSPQASAYNLRDKRVKEGGSQ